MYSLIQLILNESLLFKNFKVIVLIRRQDLPCHYHLPINSKNLSKNRDAPQKEYWRAIILFDQLRHSFLIQNSFTSRSNNLKNCAREV